jgi:hypothetical protein
MQTRTHGLGARDRGREEGFIIPLLIGILFAIAIGAGGWFAGRGSAAGASMTCAQTCAAEQRKAEAACSGTLNEPACRSRAIQEALACTAGCIQAIQ